MLDNGPDRRIGALVVTHSQKAIDLASEFEGCKLEAYKDLGGVWTIGYGHTGPEVCEGLKITQDRALQLLSDDMLHADAVVNKMVSVRVNQNQFDALVDFVFNVGSGNFAQSSLLKFLNIGQSLLAAKEFERWDKVKGKDIPGLLRRRLAERDLFLEAA